MAEIVVGAVITVLCEKLISGELMKLARSEGIDSKLKKWKRTLPLIQAVLADAGNKQTTESAVQLWLNDLHDLAYEIDDVLDDLATEAMRRKLKQESHASSSSTSNKVLKFIPTCCSNFTPGNIMYGRQMSSKLDEITTKLKDLVEVKIGLGLNPYVNVERSNYRIEGRSEETSLVDESKILGREGDKEALLGKLLGNGSCDQNVSVVSIVGLGGMGKTTLAGVLYDQQKVKDHFPHRAWVSVPADFDLGYISKTIFQTIAGESKDFPDLNQLHEALREKLIAKRFLVVLDNVWNIDQNKWERLQNALVGAPGSKIMVTTRNTMVASDMGCDEPYDLEVLSNEDALSLFAQHALGEKNFDKHPTLKVYGEAFVKKCGSLPLALRTLGKVLKTKRNGDEWEKLLNNELWHIKKGSEILPALRLSYNDLPAELKHLFAYCSLFPKGYVFDKNKLVLLWMAEGFLSQLKGNKSMESLGHECFEELQLRSFFQNAKLGYTMHDLINDLATSVAGEFFLRLDDKMDVSNKTETLEKVRYFSLVGPQWGSYRKLKEVHKATCLRTFFPVSVGRGSTYNLSDNLAEVLPQLHSLRVLSVTNLTPAGIIWESNQQITKVPESIGSLKHLRYLNFSYTKITCLPEQVSNLFNLQSLLVFGCPYLSGLPESFGKLINLRHLDISDTPRMEKIPFGIGGMTSLQTLPKVIIGGANGFNISELKGLSDLQGELTIKGLEKVIISKEADDANLHQKKGLDVLVMEWSNWYADSFNERNEYEVLKGLRPHQKLTNLKILSYKGARFPSWVGDPSFHQLTELSIRDCRCTYLPTLGHLQSLKTLFVENMNEVKTVGPEFLEPTDSFRDIAFPSLEYLEFRNMKGWETWSTSGGDVDGTARLFPRLGELYIKDCPKLLEVSIGFIPSLQVLGVDNCSEVVLRSIVRVSSSLVALRMYDVKGLTQLHGDDLMHLGAVEDLYIAQCDELRYLWEPELEACKILVSLQELEVRKCKNLVSLGEKDVNFGINMESVKEVSYNGAYIFEKPRSSLTKSVNSDCLGSLPLCLRSLKIYECQNLKSFSHEHFRILTSLEQLCIYDCPSIDYSFPCGLWPPNLRKLEIGDLNKPMTEWGQQSYPISLVKLTLYGKNSGVVSFAVGEEDVMNTTSSSFLLPPSLVSLTLHDFEDVESLSQVLQHLPCLKRLDIYSCRKLRDLPQTSSNLYIGRHKDPALMAMMAAFRFMAV